MVIHRSKFPKGSLENIARRGKIISIEKKEFKVMFKNKKEGEKIYNLIQKDSLVFEIPLINTDILGIFYNSKIEYINKIYTLSGKKIYQSK